ncbi:MAG: hypothetical protein K0S24_2401 [Sphingobacterium sp.]|jgi:hypothetical protein|nr:hypothetical protein [Sphingobacterium sp.]
MKRPTDAIRAKAIPWHIRAMTKDVKVIFGPQAVEESKNPTILH